MIKKIQSHITQVALYGLTSILFILPVVVRAQYFTNPISSTTLDGFLLRLLDVVILIGAIAVVFFLILAGFKYVTARGDEKQISSATSTLTWTVVGAAIILGARVIASAIRATVDQLGI